MGKRKTKATGDNAGSGEYPRPVWVDDGSAAEMPNFAPSPSLYFCACSFVWAEARNAYLNGDYSLLARAGIADALEFIINPNNAGTDGAAYSEMLDDWRLFMSAKNARAKTYKIASGISADIPRVDFWRKFDADADRDADALDFRRELLTERCGELLRLALKLKANGELDLFNGITDSFLFPNIDTANPEPARVRAYWLNDAFSLAGAEMARWLSVATLPNYEKQIAELRARIAENFGVFPAPFECATDGAGDICTPRTVILLAAKIHELNGDAEKADKARKAAAKIPARHYLRLAGDELTTLLHIARAQARQAAHGARLPDVPASGRKRATDAGENKPRLNAHAATLIKEYRPNVSFYLRTEKGEDVLIDELTSKQWEGARELLEGATDGDGWVKMPEGWKRPTRCKGKQAVFWERVHSKVTDSRKGDGKGFYRIEKTPATMRRGGTRTRTDRGAR